MNENPLDRSGGGKTARLILADDHELLRRGLRVTLAAVDRWKIVGEAGTGREAVELASKLDPDLAILDITMPDLNGLDATRQIVAANSRIKILILTMHESEQVVREVLAAGAQGYLLKSDAGRSLVQAVEALLDNQPHFTSKVARLVLQGYLEGHRETSQTKDAPALSMREREIVQLLAEGKSNKEVAEVLGISVKTAETHRTNIMRKLDFHSITDLVRYAIRNKMVEP
jgi:DNA-binding NarL/FixJ family response regulator